MFKKRVLFALILISSIVVFFLFFNKPSIHSEAGILIDATSGKVIYAKNEHEVLPVASVSKMMSAYLVLEAIANSEVNWEDQIVISEQANNLEQRAVQIPVDDGESVSVKDLFASLLIPSANNATIALAEYVAGSEEQFVQRMNEKAVSMGLSDETTFVNATGLTVNGAYNKMSALDGAMLANHLITDFPLVLQFTNKHYYDLNDPSLRIYNTNRLLFSNDPTVYDKRVDGLKTGYTTEAGYCIVSTAFVDDERYISVIIGADDDDMRFEETKKMLSYGFKTVYVPWLEQAKQYIRHLLQ